MTGPWSARMLSQASADEVRDEEGCDDEEQEEVSPGPPERDPVHERVGEQERRGRRDHRVEERAEKLLSVVGERIREVRELPGELEVPVRPGLERLVAEESERDQEEEARAMPSPAQQEVRREPGMLVEERAHATLWDDVDLAATGPSPTARS